MSEHDLGDLVRSGARIQDHSVARLPISRAVDHLLEEIMRTPVLANTPDFAEPAAPTTGRRRRARLALAGAAAVTALALTASLALPTGGGGNTFAAELVAVAQANDRILIDDPAWRVTRVDDFTVDTGEMTFSDGTYEVHLHWDRADQYRNVLSDRNDLGDPDRVPVLGTTGLRYHYADADYETLLPPRGPNYVRIRGDVGDEAGYRRMLAALRTVDVDTWLAALPESAVEPDERSRTISAMLRDIPTPPGFDPARIRAGSQVSDRYALGYEVTGALSCAWVSRWQDAKVAGQTGVAREAVAAMATSRQWRILREMDAAGAFPKIVWEVADQMSRWTTEQARADITAQVAPALGCD